jgi:hypothetical protein
VLISMAAAVAAIIFVMMAVICLFGALYLFLVTMSVSPPLAALVVGLTGFGLAGLIILAAGVTSRCHRPGRWCSRTGIAGPGCAGNANDLAAELAGRAAQELTARALAHPYRAFVGALLAGLLIGGSAELRDVFNGTIKK